MKLSVVQNNKKVSDFHLNNEDVYDGIEIFVGRSEDCHVLIHDPMVSRYQFVLRLENEFWQCHKLSSSMPMTINGQIIEEDENEKSIQVKSGDVIKFQNYEVCINDITSPEELPHQQQDQNLELVASEEEEPADYLSQANQSQDHQFEENNQEDQNPEQDLEHEDKSVSFSNEFSHDENKIDDDFENSDHSDQSMNLETDSMNNNLFEDNDFPHDDLVPLDSDDKTKIFKSFITYELIIVGDYAPYDRYQIDEEVIFIGRDQQTCQITLEDPEVSQKHARLSKVAGQIQLEDLGSSNGTLLNGERINKALLNQGDEFLVGETSFTLSVQSDLLSSESERLMPVDLNQVVEREEVLEEYAEEDGFNIDDGEQEHVQKSFFKDPQKRKIMIYVIGLIGLYFVLFYDNSSQDVSVNSTKKNTQNKQASVKEDNSKKNNISEELKNARKLSYELGASYFEQGRYDLAQIEFEKVFSIDPQFKNIQSYLEQTKIALQKIEEMDAKKREEEERLRIKKIVGELLEKAREAVANKNVAVAENYFSQIIEKDPENYEVIQLRLELEAWQKDQEEKALEKAIAQEKRNKMLEALAPGKTSFLKKQWYKAIIHLEAFLMLKGIDEDLIKEANDMFSKAKKNLDNEIGPLIAKAKGFEEALDFKSAFSTYQQILAIHPRQKVALTQIEYLRERLHLQSKKIFREALISESLSLFEDAKVKFEEVKEVSPTDSEYYKKANEKLKDYLE